VEHESMPPSDQRQTLMFSATFPEAAEQLAHDFLKSEVVRLTAGISGSVNEDVQQTFIEIADSKAKRATLQRLLDEHPSTKKDAVKPEHGPRDSIIVFTETKKTADYLAGVLSLAKYNSVSIHGDRTQEQREKSLREFKNGTYCILVATAVCAHGLDIQGVTKVINYDLPEDIDLYVHKVGRTARVGNPGTAVSFFCPDTDFKLAPDLVRVLNDCGQPVPEFISDAAAGAASYIGGAVDTGAVGGNTEVVVGW